MASKKHVHLIGIGGISMSGIAQMLLKRGYKVSGSDLKDSPLLDRLRRSGANVYIGHSPENIKGADMIVISTAIPEDNSELQAARKAGLPVYGRAQMIAKLMEDKKTIAISGTHGKTTTTSMVATILKENKMDPTVMVGGVLNNIGGNVYLGKGEYFVTEADESDGSLLYFDPSGVVVTNIEFDHHDYYDSKEKLLNTFKEFVNKIPKDGKAIVYAEDDNIRKILDNEDRRVLTYGINAGKLKAININTLPFGSYYNLVYGERVLGEIRLQVPGVHNVLNSLAAVAVGMYVGLSFTDIQESLGKFYGVHRRFEKKGLIDSILIIDDYAHHPTEIKATLKAARNTGYERIIAIFQPHRYSRTRHFMEEFAKCFDDVDHLIVTDIYSASEKPIPGVTAEKLALKIDNCNGPDVDYIPELEEVVDYVEKIIKPRDLVITIGAGNVYKVGDRLVNRLREKREMA
ncbi:UDP-N-acetylmuramate--L-alanine ligase [Halothermothrix orenii]|uniref:UDP-N-acetylmuramate--L-alanine ligase n=1 Tax=Halothermothrix orenii (strain H 168 / OCM 544 / DSM 9562) TaxID=373903 RepID=B8CWJ7_HALOH|nr:UDP-N-acetylmuramate--L-alanine ligase [Halothermothrix orenii]ACL69666.1 UDP-N-acetylmuramate--alanine ligase [Halothermothrix orenii H 168]